MGDLWDPRWADILADLLVVWERAEITDRNVEEAIAAIQRLPDGGERVGRAVLAKFLASGERLSYFSATIARLITPAVAEWLTQQSHSRALMETIAKFGSTKVRRTLAPHLDGLVEHQDETVATMRAAEELSERRETRRLKAQQTVVLTSNKLGPVLKILSCLNKRDWPELDAPRGAWLAQEYESWFRQIDPLTSVHWLSENQLSHNPALPWLVRIIDHYSLQIGNDVLMVQSLMACESGPIATYQRGFGLSGPAVAELERILADPSTPSGAIYHFLGFIGETEISTASLGAGLVAIADNAQHPDHIRSWAVTLACSKGVPDDQLVPLTGRLHNGLKDTLERGLIDRQHRPTIERRIAALLAEDAAMQAGEVPFPHDSSLGWIGHITSDVFWPRLVALREQALRLALPHVAGLVTGVMAKMDGVRLAAVVREQIPVTPAAWQTFRNFERVNTSVTLA